MNATEWWKTFDLNTELHTAGGFIYDGLYQLEQCKHLQYKDEIFEILYHLAVGFERLMKVSIVLLEHTDKVNQTRFENSLHTHDLCRLLPRIRGKRKVALGKPHDALIHCLSEFYRVYRYDRYQLATVRQRDRLRTSFQRVIEKGGGIKVGGPDELFPPADMRRIRRYVGKITGKVCAELYHVIAVVASKKNIYTSELRSDSKAYKIFVRKEYDFESESIALKELLLFLFKTHEETPLAKILKDVHPLPFDPPLAVERMAAFIRNTERFELVDMVEEMHEEFQKLGERKEWLEWFGPDANNIFTEDEFEEMREPPPP